MMVRINREVPAKVVLIKQCFSQYDTYKAGTSVTFGYRILMARSTFTSSIPPNVDVNCTCSVRDIHMQQ